MLFGIHLECNNENCITKYKIFFNKIFKQILIKLLSAERYAININKRNHDHILKYKFTEYVFYFSFEARKEL